MTEVQGIASGDTDGQATQTQLLVSQRSEEVAVVNRAGPTFDFCTAGTGDLEDSWSEANVLNTQVVPTTSNTSVDHHQSVEHVTNVNVNTELH